MDMNQIKAYSNYKQDSGMNKVVAVKPSTKDGSRICKPEKHNKVLLEYSSGALVEGSPAAVYEKSDLITLMKKDTEERINQLRNMVSSELEAQAGISVGKDDIWKFLANGKFTVSAAAKEQAKELISEDGYYGVEQTSNRILKFAMALSGNDASKADLFFDAFKKGFEKATNAWGKELPDICQKTYEAVEKKMNDWKNSQSSVDSQ